MTSYKIYLRSGGEPVHVEGEKIISVNPINGKLYAPGFVASGGGPLHQCLVVLKVPELPSFPKGQTVIPESVIAAVFSIDSVSGYTIGP